MDLALVATAFQRLQIAPPPQLILLEAHEFASRHYPPNSPDVSTLITSIDSRPSAEQLRAVLLAVYPSEHVVQWVSAEEARPIRLGEVGGNSQPEASFGAQACLFVPALDAHASFESLAEIVAHLRAPNGCPWDREQTHATLRTHLLEESYETLAAIDSGDGSAMREEFGDLLLQVMLNAQIASESSEFNVTQIIDGIGSKLIRRHPHVFGDVQVSGVDDVLHNWEKLKEQERKEKGAEQSAENSLLDGIPAALPALAQAQEYQNRAARVGFDWPAIDGVLDKVIEEIEEIRTAHSQDELMDEIGDLFFVLVNFARWQQVDAESALRATNLKFKRRFGYVERSAKKQERALSDMTLAEMDALWDEAKSAQGSARRPEDA